MKKNLTIILIGKMFFNLSLLGSSQPPQTKISQSPQTKKNTQTPSKTQDSSSQTNQTQANQQAQQIQVQQLTDKIIEEVAAQSQGKISIDHDAAQELAKKQLEVHFFLSNNDIAYIAAGLAAIVGSYCVKKKLNTLKAKQAKELLKKTARLKSDFIEIYQKLFKINEENYTKTNSFLNLYKEKISIIREAIKKNEDYVLLPELQKYIETLNEQLKKHIEKSSPQNTDVFKKLKQIANDLKPNAKSLINYVTAAHKEIAALPLHKSEENKPQKHEQQVEHQ